MDWLFGGSVEWTFFGLSAFLFGLMVIYHGILFLGKQLGLVK